MKIPIRYICGGDLVASTILTKMPRTKSFDEHAVLERAMHLFWKQGYAATSVQDLVKHLGINRASIYDTYGDKENLFLEAFALYRKTSIQGLKDFLDKHIDVRSGFKKLFEAAIEESVNDTDKRGCFAVNTTTELIPGDDRILSILEENRASLEKLFLNYLKRGAKAGQLSKDKDLKALATLLYTLFNGIKVVSKVNSNKKTLKASIKQIMVLLD